MRRLRPLAGARNRQRNIGQIRPQSPQHADLGIAGARAHLVCVEPEARERMAQQRQYRRGAAARLHARERKPRQNAVRRVAQRIAAGIVNLNVPTRKLGAHAAGEIAIRRNQRGGAAGMLQRLAQSHSDGQRFLALVGGLDKRHSAKGFYNSLMAQRAPESGPGLRGFRRRQSLRCKGDARSKLRRGLAQFAHVLPVNPDDSQQSTQRRLRVAVGGIKIGLQRANRAPCRLVHMQIEAWQNDGAIGRGCDGGDQPRSGRVGSRGTCNNLHACGALCQLRNAAGDKFRLSACAIHAVNCAQIKRPMFAGDCEKVQRDAPVFVKRFGRKAFQQAPVHVFDDHLVDEIGKIAR